MRRQGLNWTYKQLRKSAGKIPKFFRRRDCGSPEDGTEYRIWQKQSADLVGFAYKTIGKRANVVIPYILTFPGRFAIMRLLKK